MNKHYYNIGLLSHSLKWLIVLMNDVGWYHAYHVSRHCEWGFSNAVMAKWDILYNDQSDGSHGKKMMLHKEITHYKLVLKNKSPHG